MRRLSPLRLMTSHTHLYAKLDEFGKDFNAVIKKQVSNECQYLNVHQRATCITNTTSIQQVSQVQPTPSVQQGCLAQPTTSTSLQQVSPAHPTASSLEQVCPAQPTTSTSFENPTMTTAVDHVAVLESPITQTILQPDKGRKITFDNFDIYQEVHHMTEQNQNKDKHYVTVMSTENRISGAHLRRNEPIGDISTLENGKCVPNQIEHQKQKENYVVLVSRILTANIQCLKHLEEVVLKHIPHRYHKETAQATDTVSYFILSGLQRNTFIQPQN